MLSQVGKMLPKVIFLRRGDLNIEKLLVIFHSDKSSPLSATAIKNIFTVRN
jgi:hypothetical protein